MARTNKLKLSAQLIEGEIAHMLDEIQEAVTACQYGKARMLEVRQEGFRQALRIVKGCIGDEK